MVRELYREDAHSITTLPQLLSAMHTVRPLLKHTSFTDLMSQLNAEHFKKAAEQEFNDIVDTRKYLNSIKMWFEASEVRKCNSGFRRFLYLNAAFMFEFVYCTLFVLSPTFFKVILQRVTFFAYGVERSALALFLKH